MADSNEEHPYGTCEGCGADIWQQGGRPGDEYCHSCQVAYKKERGKKVDEEHKDDRGKKI